jgi:hypothetical protein
MSNIFKKGDRVILINKLYRPAKSNPLHGSSFSCVGTVTNAAGVVVDWDNGTRNGYYASDLQLFVRKSHNHPLTKIFK